MKMSERHARLKQNMHGKPSVGVLNNKSGVITVNEKINRRMIFSLSLILVMVFVVTVTTSYAFFNTTIKAKEFVIYTGNLAVDYAKKTNVISLDNLYPMTDVQGLALTGHEFTVTNNGNIDARYQIRLELDESLNDMIDIQYIKLAYQVNGGEYSTPILLSDLNSSLVFIKDVIVAQNENNSYGIKLWIDLSAPNDIQGKTFKARVVVDSIQNVEDGYVVDTRPIITLNKTNEGTTDINLKLNETYTELGVEKVEDDLELFIPSQVTKTYEYYDGTNLITVNSIDTSKTGIYYVNYSIVDKSDNVGKAIRIVTVNNTDTIPTIKLKGEADVTLGENDDYVESGVTVANNNQVVIIGEVKTSIIGTYALRYIVIDENNNLNSVIRTVKVEKIYEEELLNGADPILTNNLVPVIISDTGVVTKASTASMWYDYETKQWANAVVLKDDNVVYDNGEIIPEQAIESYFVWIPKYSYQLWDLGKYSSLTSADSKEQQINIRFGLTNTSDSVSGECITPKLAGESGNCDIGEYMTHPAFLAFDTNGLWVGKFETGYNGAISVDEAKIDSDDSSKVIIKPNVYSWRSLTLGNMFKASFDYLRTDESHMMKNTEWGAVAYLSHSIYGTCIADTCGEVRVNNNSAYITGYASVEEPTKGSSTISIDGNHYESTSLGIDGTYAVNYLNSSSIVSSTTGNKTGIYDMSGGANEYLMAYNTKSTQAGGNSGIVDLYEDFFNNSNYINYWDRYTGVSSGIYYYDNRILGDATGEMGPFYSAQDPDNVVRRKSSWYADYSHNTVQGYPWLVRGCTSSCGSSAGIFAFDGYDGSASTNASFRIVLAP